MSAEQGDWLLSTPDQQIASLVNTRDFLARLTDHRRTPRIPRAIRSEAQALLRHYLPESRLRPLIEGQVRDQPRRRTGTKREPRLIPRSATEFRQWIQRQEQLADQEKHHGEYTLPW